MFVYFPSSSFVPLCSSNHKKFEIYWTPTKLACFAIEGVGGRTAMFSDSHVTSAVNKTRGIEMSTLRGAVFECSRPSDHLEYDRSLVVTWVNLSFDDRRASEICQFWWDFLLTDSVIRADEFRWKRSRKLIISSSAWDVRKARLLFISEFLGGKPSSTSTTDNQIIASTRSSFDQRCLVFTVASIGLIRKKHSSRRLSQSMLIGNRTTNRNLFLGSGQVLSKEAYFRLNFPPVIHEYVSISFRSAQQANDDCRPLPK